MSENLAIKYTTDDLYQLEQYLFQLNRLINTADFKDVKGRRANSVLDELIRIDHSISVIRNIIHPLDETKYVAWEHSLKPKETRLFCDGLKADPVYTFSSERVLIQTFGMSTKLFNTSHDVIIHEEWSFMKQAVYHKQLDDHTAYDPDLIINHIKRQNKKKCR